MTTNFSFLRGASHPEEFVEQAYRLGLKAIGIADRNSLAGVVRAYVFARENEIAPETLRVVTGCRLVFCDGTPDILAYPQDRAAYARLTRLLTRGNMKGQKGLCRLTAIDLLEAAEGLQLAVLPDSTWEPEDAAAKPGKVYDDFVDEAEKRLSPLQGECREPTSPPCGDQTDPTLLAPRPEDSQRNISASASRGCAGPRLARRKHDLWAAYAPGFGRTRRAGSPPQSAAARDQ